MWIIRQKTYDRLTIEKKILTKNNNCKIVFYRKYFVPDLAIMNEKLSQTLINSVKVNIPL